MAIPSTPFVQYLSTDNANQGIGRLLHDITTTTNRMIHLWPGQARKKSQRPMNGPRLSPPMGHSELADNKPLTLHTKIFLFEMWSANRLSSPLNLCNAFCPRSQCNYLPFQYLSSPTTPTENSFGPANYILMPRISQSNHPPDKANSTVLSSLGVVANESPPVPTRTLSEFIGYINLSPVNACNAFRPSSLRYLWPFQNCSPSAIAFTGNSFRPPNSILRPRISCRHHLPDKFDPTVLSGLRVMENALPQVPNRGNSDLIQDESLMSLNVCHAFCPSSLRSCLSSWNQLTSAAPRRSSARPPFLNIRPKVSHRGHSPSGSNSLGQFLPSLNVVANMYSPVSTTTLSLQ